MSELTEAEREAVAFWDRGEYFCACEDESCPTLPCRNDRRDLFAVVAKIKAAAVADALAPVRTLADEWESPSRPQVAAWKRQAAAEVRAVLAAEGGEA